MKQFFCLLVIFLLCSACASTDKVKLVNDDDRRWLLSGEALPDLKAEDFTKKMCKDEFIWTFLTNLTTSKDKSTIKMIKKYGHK